MLLGALFPRMTPLGTIPALKNRFFFIHGDKSVNTRRLSRHGHFQMGQQIAADENLEQIFESILPGVARLHPSQWIRW
jgi:hypothetical protein